MAALSMRHSNAFPTRAPALGGRELRLGDGEEPGQRSLCARQALEEVLLEDGVDQGAALGRFHLPDLLGKRALGDLQHTVVEEPPWALGVGLEPGGRHGSLGEERGHAGPPRRSRRTG